MKKAVVLSFNWDTQKFLFSDFEGKDAELQAQAFRLSVLDDFPESEGWSHFVHTNDKTSTLDSLLSGLLQG